MPAALFRRHKRLTLREVGFIFVFAYISETMIIQPDRFLRALSDPTRLRILALLSEDRELCVCELTGALEMVQPKVSRHLGVLREAAVLLDRREGLWIYYRLHPDLPSWAVRALTAVRDGCRGKTPYADDRKRLEAVPPQAAVTCKARVS